MQRMLSDFFHAVIYDPLYNLLVFLIGVVPYADVGLAVIAVTVVVRLVLFPLFSKAIRVQIKVKKIEPELKRIKQDYPDDRHKQAERTMELYRQVGVNPFAGILTVLVQIPIFITLYLIFLNAGLPEINTDLLYAFVPTPDRVNMDFLGLIPLSQSSFILAGLAGLSQFFQIKVSPLGAKKERSENPDFKEDFARSMQMQMQYGLPVVIAVVAYVVTSAVALYWITNNLFGIVQEVFVRRRIERDEEAKQEASDSTDNTQENGGDGEQEKRGEYNTKH